MNSSPLESTSGLETMTTDHFLGDGCNQPSLESMKTFFESVLKLGIAFKLQPTVNSNYLPIPATTSFGAMPNKGLNQDQLLAEFQNLAQSCSNWSSPSFMGFPDSGNSTPGLGAAILIPFLNQNLANQDICAPMATFLEMEVVHWLRSELGFQVPAKYSTAEEIGGILTLGGCLSNTIALMAAREHLFPGSGMEGLPVLARSIRVLVPDIIEHYSIRSAMSWLSLGEANVIRIPVDEEFRIRISCLETSIDEERAKGHYILACVAYAGDSRSMRVDNLDGLAQILEQKNVWFHVDACHGSQLAFSKSHKHKIRGIEKADSVTIDPHKVLWIPNTCSFVLFKDPRTLASISTNSDLILKTQWSLGQITPCIGSKAFDALKLWSSIKFFGRSGIGKLVDQRLTLTKDIQNAIRNDPDLVLLNDTDINSTILMFIPEGLQRAHRVARTRISASDCEKLSVINQVIKTTITTEGRSYIHGFTLKWCPNEIFRDHCPVYVLRIMNGNPLTLNAHVDRLLKEITKLGRNMIKKSEYCLYPEPVSEPKNLPVIQSLVKRMNAFFGNIEYAAILYGSTTGQMNYYLSDVDIMVFIANSEYSQERATVFEDLFKDTMRRYGVRLDAEVPYNRKLLIPLSFAQQSAQGLGFAGRSPGSRIPSVEKTEEYLRSDEMLARLVLNVLTTSTVQIAGKSSTLSSVRSQAEIFLISLIIDVDPKVKKQDCFIQSALSDGKRSGEEYLGYKNRPEVIERLRSIWSGHAPRSLS
jgi:L-2,4-diaminobutyrate decarboxylase